MSTATRIRLDSFGGPEVMTLEQVNLPAPGPGEVEVRQTAVGFNYIDVYQRSGIYPLPTPTGLGHEAAGVVEAVGAGVTGVRPGDRVAYINAGIGAYADRRIVPADRLVPIPGSVSDEAAAALIFKGLTAQYLIRKTHKVGPGDTILVHAAAGGVGQILSAWAKALGATVIGTAGGPSKVAVAKAAGCDVAIDYRQEDWPEQVIAATGGKKVGVAYDSVGEATFLKTLDLIAPFGLMISYGSASGPAPAVTMELLNKKGCLFVTRPSIFPHNADPAVLKENAADLFAAISDGIVTPAIAARFKLSEAVEAHRVAEARTTAGSILLIP